MKKISYFEIASLLLVIIISFNSGINLYLLKQDIGVNSWLAIILGYIMGIIPLSMILYMANYKPELNILEKSKHIFGDMLGTIINVFISFILFIIAITLLYNIVSFIATQFLYRTPVMISAIIFILLVIYGSTKEINVITHVGFLLMIINVMLFLLADTSLISEVKLDNLLPFLKVDYVDIISGAFKIMIVNILPIGIVLIVPKDKITNGNKYGRALIISYIMGFLISLLIVISTIGSLGIYLTNLFEYSEYMALKEIRLFGFLERVENVISIQFITEVYIYITVIIYMIGKNIYRKNDKSFKMANVLIGIVLIISIKIGFKNITYFNNFIDRYFVKIVSLLIIWYLVMFIGIIIKKKRECKIIKKEAV